MPREPDDASMETPIRLLVIDDEVRVRRGLVMRLRSEPEIEVVGDCETQVAPSWARRLQPGLVLMDLGRDAHEAGAAVARLRAAAPCARIVVLAVREDAQAAASAVAAGAQAVVGATEGSERLVEIIRAVAGVRLANGREEPP